MAGAKHIPYRNSILTQLLRDSLGGNCKTILIGNIWCEEDHIEETISTLQFAQQIMRVESKVEVNISGDISAQLKKLQHENRELRRLLQSYGRELPEGINRSEDEVASDDAGLFDDKRRYDLAKRIQEYVKAENGEYMPIPSSTAEAIEMLRQFRLLVLHYRNKLKRHSSPINGLEESNNDAEEIDENEDEFLDEIGVKAIPCSFAPDDADPDAVPNEPNKEEESLDISQDTTKVSEEELFEEFKENEGRELNESFLQKKRALQTQKEVVKEIIHRIKAFEEVDPDLEGSDEMNVEENGKMRYVTRKAYEKACQSLKTAQGTVQKDRIALFKGFTEFKEHQTKQTLAAEPEQKEITEEEAIFLLAQRNQTS